MINFAIQIKGEVEIYFSFVILYIKHYVYLYKLYIVFILHVVYNRIIR